MAYRITLPDMEIKDKYLTDGLSSTDLGEIYHCHGVTILNHLKRLGIEIRDRQVAKRMPICRAKVKEARAKQAPVVWTERSKKKVSEAHLANYIPIMAKEDLSRLYENEMLSAFDIGRQVGCCRSTIIDLLRRYELPVRHSNWIGKGQRILPLSIGEITKMYIEREMSLQEIGGACDCTAGTIALRLRRANITIRKYYGETCKAKVASSERMLKFHRDNPEFSEGRNNSFYGKHHSYETRVKIKQARARQIFTKEAVLKRVETVKRLWASYTDEERNNRMRKTRVNVKPNKPERYLLNLLEFMFPNEWKYTGDGALMIRGKNPDFANVNGQKKLIELFGTYWHRNENPKDRIKLYRGYGYETLVIWEHELCNQKRLLRRIIDFAMVDKD